ncbi:MAG: DNA polymerase III subunit delta' [Chloroflexi bacterium]|nr:DNA polymerase III subunit delta' [Chloroflexota bacterium]
MWTVLGQEPAVTLLKASLDRNRLSHAYILSGPTHVGKMTLALNLAQALNCQAEAPPCQECSSCHRIAAGQHPDVQIIVGEGERSRGEIGIDRIRSLQSSAFLHPYQGRCRVFIIDGADRLTREAANCLLKILEEPPINVFFLLLAAEPKGVLPTIRSRCQYLELRPMALGKVEMILLEHYSMTKDMAKLLARLSKGRLGWAITASSDNSLLEQRQQRLAELRALAKGDLHQRFAYASQMASQFHSHRGAVQEALGLWRDWWQDLLLIKAECPNLITNIDNENILIEEAEVFSLPQAKDFLSALETASWQLDQNANPRLVLEALMLSIPPWRRREGTEPLAQAG